MMKTIRKLILVTLTLTAAFVAGADTVLAFVPCAETAQTSNSIPTDVSSPADGDFTWEAWFNSSNLDSAENRMVAQTGWAWNSPGRLMLAVRKNGKNPSGNNPALEAFYYNGGNKRVIGSTVVTAGWHHAALVRQGADDERLAAQLRIVPHFDGGIEGVHIHVDDDGVHAPRLLHPARRCLSCARPVLYRKDYHQSGWLCQSAAANTIDTTGDTML